MITRNNKGRNLIDFPNDFIVLDLETTGLDPYYNEIIEIAALKIRNGVISDTFETLIKPNQDISDFITNLTGISNEMVNNAPCLSEVLPQIFDFISDDIILGHNINFDINFLYDDFDYFFKKPLSNNFIDTMRLSRKAFPNLPHHRLIDIAEYFNISPNGYHRALQDCQTTYECFLKIKEYVFENIGIDEFIKSFGKKGKNLNTLTSKNISVDETNPFYQKLCVFTGKLEKMERVTAAQLVVNMGGKCEDRITKNTNFLILGNNDYCSTIKDGKSSKQKKAEEYKLKGLDIEIISENTFYDMLEYSSDEGTESNEQMYLYEEKEEKTVESIIAEVLNIARDKYGYYKAHEKGYFELKKSATEKELYDVLKYSFNKDGSIGVFIDNMLFLKVNERQNNIFMKIEVHKALFSLQPVEQVEQPVGFVKMEFKRENFNNIFENILTYTIENYFPSHRFGCCSKYEECSDAKCCLHEDKFYAKGCYYRENLEQGRIFYSKNAT